MASSLSNHRDPQGSFNILTTAIYFTAVCFPLPGFSPINPKHDLRVIRRQTIEQAHSLAPEMSIEEGQCVIIDDPGHPRPLQTVVAVCFGKHKGDVAKTIVQRAANFDQITERFRSALQRRLALAHG